MTQVYAGGVAVDIVFLKRCIGDNPSIHNYYSMAMVRIMHTSVGKINSCERSQRLCKKIYHTVLTCQKKITVLQPMCVLDAMYAIHNTDHIENAVYIYIYMTSYKIPFIFV